MHLWQVVLHHVLRKRCHLGGILRVSSIEVDEEGSDDTAQDEPHGGTHQQGEHGHPDINHGLRVLLAIPCTPCQVWQG